jgi:hypothetical protein
MSVHVVEVRRELAALTVATIEMDDYSGDHQVKWPMPTIT